VGDVKVLLALINSGMLFTRSQFLEIVEFRVMTDTFNWSDVSGVEEGLGGSSFGFRGPKRGGGVNELIGKSL